MKNNIQEFIDNFYDRKNIFVNEPLKKYLYYKIGGVCKAIYFPNSIEELIEAIKFINKHPLRYKIIGNGSNLLASDEYLNILIIYLNNIFKDFYVTDKINNHIYIGSSWNMISASRKLANLGYTGHEFFSGIPGNIGGGIYMNAGTSVGEIKDKIISVDILKFNGEYTTLYVNEKDFSYRKSVFQKNKNIIIGAIFKFEKEKIKGLSKKKLISSNFIRKQKQPLNYPNCGSIFKNPDPKNGIYAGKIIDSLGLKGVRIGDAQISNIHGNFIINLGKASFNDVMSLINLVQKKVYECYKIELVKEVEILK